MKELIKNYIYTNIDPLPVDINVDPFESVALSRLIDSMIKHGYPKEKMFYYRSGFEGWKLLGLTTIVHKEIKK